ncbi:MAG: phosphoribosylamine--glycine ligase [Candidatus Eremiobacteraeota bacterium]|nr:phosphoribosylamine--glycine ligase [Candidatus Eremiobacteraeota bacterium]
MRVLVIGSGGREDALSWRLERSPSVEAVFAAPGNAGTATRGENWNIAATDGKALAERAKTAGIELVVLGPETAIAAGVGDRLREAGIAVFGPNRSSGRLESSKIFAKRFLERHGIPTATARVAHSLPQALGILNDWPHFGVAIKADGLAAGKGVIVTPDLKTAGAVVADWYANANVPGGGSDVLFEEVLEGRELSVFAICDGRAMLPLAAACDYKRAGDGDTGPNTGGMGAYSPPAGFPGDFLDVVREKIVAPTLRGLLAEGEVYVGVLYCGLMWTADGPKVLEFNARFGDPETQALMPRVQGDFARLLHSAATGVLEADAATFARDACVCVTLVSQDYPRASTPVSGLPAALDLPSDTLAFWGTSKRSDGRVDAAGGRVLTVAGTGGHLNEARARAYEAVERLRVQLASVASLTCRTDIARTP